MDETTWAIVEKIGGHCWRGLYPDPPKSAEHIVVMPDLDKMGRELDMSKSSIAQYLKAMSEAGIIKPFPNRIGRGGKVVYALGEWRGFKDPETGKSGSKQFWYLKERDDIKENLARMKLPRSK